MNYSGPYAAAHLSSFRRSDVCVSDPWDRDLIPGAREFAGKFPKASAIAGLELMETCDLCTGSPVSATADVEELRRVKTPDEIECLKQAAALADRGYQYFADTACVGMREYELVAEVEGFLKSNGAEDNFMLIASGGTEVVGMKPPTERKFQRGDSVTTELTP